MMEKKDIKRIRVAFVSEDVHCVGYLYLPSSNKRIPCIILGHGFTGTQDRLAESAEYFARMGMAAFTFDYRNFGESEGKNRQVIRIKDQLKDFKNAINFVRQRPEIDANKIGIWGSSLGGGHVISIASADPTVAAVVAQVPFNGFPKEKGGRTKESTNKLLWAMIKDALRGVFGLSPFYIKAVGNPDELAVMASSDAQKTIDAMQSNQWQNKVAPRALIDMMLYKPGKVAMKIKVPVLVCVGKYDKETSGESTRQLAMGPLAELREYPVSHFEFYRPDIRKKVLEDQAAFFKSVLIQ